MRRVWIVLISLGWLAVAVSACGGPSSPVAPEEGGQAVSSEVRPTYTPFPRPTPRIPNRVYYTKRCWPACHLDPNYVHESTKIFTDEFEGELGPGWTWLNEDPARRSLEEGVLRIVTQPADLRRLEGVPNVLWRPAPESHFDAVVEVDFQPIANGQTAVLFIQTEEGGAFFLGRGYCDGAPMCVGSGVYFSTTMSDCPPVGFPFGGKTATLMLRRSGNTYIGYVRSGEEWVEVGRCYQVVTPMYVGITAVNGGEAQVAPQVPADFESFTLVERR